MGREMRIPKYKVETVANPARPFDAIYFIDTMKPATLIQQKFAMRNRRKPLAQVRGSANEFRAATVRERWDSR